MSKRAWLAMRRLRTISTLLIRANSRKEAEEIARRGYGEEIKGIDLSHYDYGPIKVLREDKKR